MDVHADVTVVATTEQLFSWVDDLSRYPAWMPLAHAVTVVDPEDDGRPAWSVELRARVGPFARSKRLRMVRTEHTAPASVRFERVEADGRRHSPWVLDVAVAAVDDTRSRVDMHLHYGGGLWTGGVLERVLAEQIESGSERLSRVVTTTP